MIVTRVVDGDTLKIRYENGTSDTVRLLGVDTPEVNTETDPSEWEAVPSTDSARACLQTFGEQASDRAKSELAGEIVTLVIDDESDRRGRFGRVLGYVVSDGKHFNYHLVTNGLARVYDSSFSQRGGFYDAEDNAQASQLGAWDCRDVSTPTPTPTSDGSSSGETDVQIASIHEDAEGAERENLEDEYIVIENTGSAATDLSGWTVSEGDGRMYEFPRGFELEAGASVRVRTGSGSDTETDLYWKLDQPVWNNNGDTGTLRNDDDEVVSTQTYD